MSIKIKLILLFFAFTIIPVAILGILSLSRARESVQNFTLRRLEATADAKAKWLSDFFSERRGDLQVVVGSDYLKKTMPVLNELIDDRQNPAFIQAHEELEKPFRSIEKAFGYVDVMLVSPEGRLLYRANPAHEKERVGDQYHDPDGRALASARSGTYLSRVYADPHRPKGLLLAAAAPIPGPNGELLGFVVFEVDMNLVLEAIGDTEGLGKTGDTVLGIREGEAVRFISPLRYHPDAALHLAEPFRPGPEIFPIQEALFRRNGSGPAMDYRSGEVLAAWRYLPSMDWGLVIKMDGAEAFAPVVELRNLILRLGAAVVLLGAIMAFALGRSITRPILELEKGAETVGGGDLDYKIDNQNPDEIGSLSRSFDQMTERLKQVTASRDELNLEIAERKRAEVETARVKRALFTLSDCNQAMVRATDEKELLGKICEILVQTGGYRMAWIGYCENDPAKTVRRVAQAGFEDGYLENAAISWDESSPRGRGPTGAAIRTRAPVACQDILNDPAFAPWRERAVKCGYASSLALPLFNRGEVIGALMIYAEDPDSFNPEETRLLSELSDDLSYGVQHLRTRAELDKTLSGLEARVRERTAELVSQHQFISAILDTAGAVIVLLDREGRIVRFNRGAESCTGYTFEEVRGRAFWDIFLVPEEKEAVMAEFVRLKAGSFPSTFENFWLTREGDRRFIAWTNTALTAEDGEIEYIIGAGLDITERRRAEQALKRELETRAAFVELSRALIGQQGLDEIAWLVYEKARELTDSPLAFAHYMEAKTGWVIAPTLTGEVWDQCRMKDRKAVFKAWHGLWGWPIDHKKSILVNDAKNDPRAVGVPEGHVPIDRYLSVPVLMNDDLLGLIAVANSSRDYTREDEALLLRLADVYAVAIARERSNQELKASEERFRRTLDSMMEGAQILSRDFRYLYINEAAAVHGRRPVHEFIGNNLLEMYPGFEKGDAFAAIKRCLEGGAPERLENELTFPDGQKAWFELSVQPSPEGVFILSLDITERKRMETELQEAAETWRKTFDSMRDMVLIIDDQHRITRANKAFYDLTGATPAGLLGRRCYEVVHRGKRPHQLCPHALSIMDNREHTQEIYEPTLDRHFLVTTSPIPDPGGRSRSSVHVMRDITAEKKAAEELGKHRDHLEELVELRTAEVHNIVLELRKEIEERGQAEARALAERRLFNDVLETLPVYVCLLAPDYHMPFANRVFRESFGAPDGRRCFEFLFELDKPCENCETFKALDTGKPHHWNWTGPNDRDYDIHDFPFTDTDGSTMILEMGIDITERARAERARERAERELEAQRAQAVRADRLRSLGEMAAGIAHELNQPLQGVRGMAEHLVLGIDRGWELSREDIRQRSRQIVDQADRMVHVINHVRTFARGGDLREEEPIDLNRVIRDAMAIIGSQLKSKGITLETELDPELPPVLANPFSMEEVVLNLINNARDALQETMDRRPAGQSRIAVRTVHEKEAEGGSVIMAVSDNGPGIAEEIKDKVFTTFFTTKPPEKGTGLGLAICRSIVEKYGGNIEIGPSPEGGAAIVVTLPAASAK